MPSLRGAAANFGIIHGFKYATKMEAKPLLGGVGPGKPQQTRGGKARI